MSALLGQLFTDPAVEASLSAEAELRAMVAAEAALARAQARVGLLAPDVAARLSAALLDIAIDPRAVMDGAAEAGVAVPALVALLRASLPEDLANALHHGATSQDIVDTGWMLRAAAMLRRIEAQAARAADALAALSDAHRATPMLGRTRRQHATPIVFGLRAAGWLGEVTRLRARLPDLRARVLAVQLGGASGDLAAMGARDLRVVDAFAAELGLAGAAPWCAARDRMSELGAWTCALSVAFGRIGEDILQATEPEAAELSLGATGGSSTMPHKRNPIAGEALAALGRDAAAQLGLAHQMSVEERDGAAWMTEQRALARLFSIAGGAARLGADMLGGLKVDTARMAANLAAAQELPLAEAAAFALAPSLGRAAAAAFVSRAADATAAGGAPLLAMLAAHGAPLEPLEAAARDGVRGAATDAIIDAALAAHQALGRTAAAG